MVATPGEGSGFSLVATVDGANKLQQFWRITLPLLRPAILVTIIFRTLDALRVFDVFYVMFGARRSTQTMAVYAQQNLVNFSSSFTRWSICARLICVVRFKPNPSQQNDAVTLP